MQVQHTLTGESTDDARKRPSTFLYCEECDDAILRSERFNHEHDLDGMMAYEKAQIQILDEKIPDHARVDTQTYEVTFHFTCIETIRVEASDKHDAMEAAELERTYRGEFDMDVHDETRALGEPSAASVEWLELHGLLPDDHDVTQEELERVMNNT